MALSELLVTDDLTIILALVSAGLFLLHNLYKPQPLVHPILLGRQSDVARVRNPKESAVMRNYGTGMLGRVRHIAWGMLLYTYTSIVSCEASQGATGHSRPS